jgi:hypothetical protein
MWIVARPTKQDRQTAGEAARADGGGSYEGVMTTARRGEDEVEEVEEVDVDEMVVMGGEGW